jgi:hypothetical protein
MLNVTIALRRLFTHTPSSDELGYAWWYVLGGRASWVESLERLPSSYSHRVLRDQDRAATRLLETWDTGCYRAWAAGVGPGGSPSAFASGMTPIEIQSRTPFPLMEIEQ